MSSLTQWQIDPVHSNIEFEVPHMGFSLFKGKFNHVEGSVWWNEADFDSAKVEAKIDTKTVTAFGEGLYNAIVGNDFLQSEQHPHLVFKSTKVTGNGEGATLEGELTIRGVTRPITLRAQRLGKANNPFARKPMVAFRAEGELNRGDYGIVWNVPLDNGGMYLGEKVKLSLNVELLQQPST